jgi:hypothetical protein
LLLRFDEDDDLLKLFNELWRLIRLFAMLESALDTGGTVVLRRVVAVVLVCEDDLVCEDEDARPVVSRGLVVVVLALVLLRCFSSDLVRNCDCFLLLASFFFVTLKFFLIRIVEFELSALLKSHTRLSILAF